MYISRVYVLALPSAHGYRNARSCAHSDRDDCRRIHCDFVRWLASRDTALPAPLPAPLPYNTPIILISQNILGCVYLAPFTVSALDDSNEYRT